jgi:hypothetical protein
MFVDAKEGALDFAVKISTSSNELHAAAVGRQMPPFASWHTPQ